MRRPALDTFHGTQIKLLIFFFDRFIAFDDWGLCRLGNFDLQPMLFFIFFITDAFKNISGDLITRRISAWHDISRWDFELIFFEIFFSGWLSGKNKPASILSTAIFKCGKRLLIMECNLPRLPGWQVLDKSKNICRGLTRHLIVWRKGQSSKRVCPLSNISLWGESLSF